MTLTFDEATHTYRLGGMVVPSVTGVLGPIQPDYSYADPTTGTAVHKMTEAFDCGADFATDFEDFWSYADGWIRFRAAINFFPTHIEERVYHSMHRYAGTVDRIGVWRDDEPVILDIKTGDPSPWHGVQLAGYVLAAERMGLVKADITRIGVYLSGDGTYRVHEYTDPKDVGAFTACLYLHNWRAQHGL